ncbi:MAG: hypothetical protein JWQ16_1875 [Novosphingobium sp.]|nr:hypothetical protein [Novosphingobium sp.]
MDAQRLRIWLAFALPAAAWFAFQQGLAMTLRGNCAYAGFPLGIVWGVASLLACAAGGRIGLAGVRNLSGSDQFVARITVFGAGLFALAIAYQTLATAIIPPCAR